MMLYVKNMVCNRCVMVVKRELEKMKLRASHVSMGEVELEKPPTAKQLGDFRSRLLELGFELLDDRKQKQIEKIKVLLINKVQSLEIEEHFSIINYLSSKMNRDYSSLSRLFSDVEGITIEQFYIQQKIEKVKELLKYGEMNLNEITFQLGYSSAAHLSAQFKKITGLSPREFKSTGGARRPLDEI